MEQKSVSAITRQPRTNRIMVTLENDTFASVFSVTPDTLRVLHGLIESNLSSEIVKTLDSDALRELQELPKDLGLYFD